MCKKLTWFSVVLMLLTLGLMGQAFIVRGGDLPDELKVGGFLLGPQAWSFRLFTFFEAVDKAKEAGCKVIEAFPGQILSPTDSVQFNHNAAPEIWAKAQQKLESAGVRLVNYGVVNWQDKAEARKVFEFAKKMNIPAITTEPHDNSPEMVDLIEQLAKEFDIKVGFHNHPKRPDQPEYKWWDPNFVAERVKGRDKRLGAAADTGHWLRSGVRPIDGLKVLEGRIISVHLKDLNEFNNREAHDVPFGTGVADVKTILDELTRQGFNGNISIEYESDWENNVPPIKKCVEFVSEYGQAK